jgi:hypothetical protein
MPFTMDDIETLRRALSELPANRPRIVSKQNAVAELVTELTAAQRRGYSVEDLAQLLATKGLLSAAINRNGLMRRLRGGETEDLGRDETVPVVETAESWRCQDLGAWWRPRRREMAGTIGWLHSKAPVRSAMVVGDVLAEYAFGMATATDDHAVEAAASNASDHPLRERICLGGSGGVAKGRTPRQRTRA